MRLRVAVGALVLVASACSQGGATTTMAVPETTNPSVAATTSTMSATASTSDQAACRAYLRELDPFIDSMLLAFDDMIGVTSDIGAARVTLDEAADDFFRMTLRFEALEHELDALGPVPVELIETVDRVNRAVQRYADAALLASRGARSESVAQLEEAISVIAEGNILLGLATEALSSSGCTRTSVPTTAPTEATTGPCDGGAQALTLGVAYRGVIEATSNPYPANARYFCVEVPAGASTLVFTLSDLGADLDLYVGYGSIDTVQGLDAGSWEWAGQEFGTTPEHVEIARPRGGVYYLEVFDYDQGGSTYTLLAVTD